MRSLFAAACTCVALIVCSGSAAAQPRDVVTAVLELTGALDVAVGIFPSSGSMMSHARLLQGVPSTESVKPC